MLDGSLVRVSPKIAPWNRPAVHGPLQLLKVDSDNQVIAVIGIGTVSAITQRRPRATCALLAILRNSGQNIAVPRLSLERPLSRPEFFCSFVPEQRLTKSLVPGARSAGTAGVQYHAGQAEPWGFASLALCF